MSNTKYTNQIKQLSVSPINVSISANDSQDVINNKLQGQINAGGGGGGSYPLDVSATVATGQSFNPGDAIILNNGLWYSSRGAIGDTNIYMTTAIAVTAGVAGNAATGRRRGPTPANTTFSSGDFGKGLYLSPTLLGAYITSPPNTLGQYVNLIGYIQDATNIYAICDDQNGYYYGGTGTTRRAATYDPNKLGSPISQSQYLDYLGANQVDLDNPPSQNTHAWRLYEQGIAYQATNLSAVDCATTGPLTYPFTGLQTIDGYNLATSTSTFLKVLVKDQVGANQSQNGVWVASSGIWSREYTASTWNLLYGRRYIVNNGTLNKGIIYTNTNNAGGTLGTSLIVYVDNNIIRQNPTFNSAFLSGPTPTATNALVTLSQLQDFASGIQNKAAADWATTVNITLSGSQSIDGGTPTNGQRILVKNQTTLSQNGIYTYNTAGAWTRTTDMDIWSEVKGAQIRVLNGTQANNLYLTVSIVDGGTIGTNDIVWQLNSSSIADGSITDAKISAVAAINSTKIANGNVNNLEFQALDGIDTSQSIQTQINSKQGLPNKVTVNSNITLTSTNVNSVNPLVLIFNGNYTVTATSGTTFNPVARATTSTTIVGNAGDVYYLTMNSTTTSLIDITATSNGTGGGGSTTPLSYCFVKQNNVQSLLNGNNFINLDTVDQTGGPSGMTPMWASGDPSRIFIRYTGLYNITASIRSDTNPAGTERYIWIAHSVKGQVAGSGNFTTGGSTTYSVSCDIYCNAGESILLGYYNGAASAVNTSPGLGVNSLRVMQTATTGTQSIVVNGSYAMGYAMGGLSAQFDASTTGTVFPISQNVNSSSTLPIISNRITLKAGQTYELEANGYLNAASTATGFCYFQWRNFTTTTFIGVRGLAITESFTGNFSGGNPAKAVITVGSNDIQVDLVSQQAVASSVFDASGFYAIANQLSPQINPSVQSSYTLGQAYSRLSSNFTATSIGAQIPIGGNPDMSSTLPIVSNLVTLRAGKSYLLTADMTLSSTSSSGALLTYAWRLFGSGTNPLGAIGTSITPSSTTNVTNGTATALVNVGPSDATYELYIVSTVNSPIIDFTTSFINVDQKGTNVTNPMLPTYSFNEQDTGRTFTEGGITSKVYEKIIPLNSTTTPTASNFFTNNAITVNHGISNLKRMFPITGTISETISGTTYQYAMPYINASGNSTNITANSTQLVSRTASVAWGSTSDALIYLTYTKTTG